MCKRVLLLAVTLFFVAAGGCATRHPVYKQPEKKGDVHGVYYSLPYTKVLLAIPVTRTTITAGKYFKYAEEMLFYIGQEPATKDSVSFRLGAPQVTTVTSSDKDNVFRVELKAGPFQRRALDLTMNQLGLLTGATSQVEDKKLEVGLAIVKTVAKAVAAAYAPATPPASPTAKEAAAADDERRQAWEVARQIKAIREKRIELLGGSSGLGSMDKDSLAAMLAGLDEQEEQLLGMFFGEEKEQPWIAQVIMDPGKDKRPISIAQVFSFNSLLGVKPAEGVTFLEGPPPRFTYTDESACKAAGQLWASLATLSPSDRAEVEKTLFVCEGKRSPDGAKPLKEAIVSVEFARLPGAADAIGPVIHQHGNCPAHQEGKCAAHEHGKCAAHEHGKCAGHEGGKCAAHEHGKCPVHECGGPAVQRNVKPSGFYYRVPAEGQITVKRDSGVLLSTSKPIAQFGEVVSLPIGLGSILMSNYDLTLDPTTGGLTHVKTDTQPISAAFVQTNVDPTVEQITAAVQAKAAQDASREAAKASERAAMVQALKDSISQGQNFGLTGDDIAKIQKAIGFASTILGLKP